MRKEIIAHRMPKSPISEVFRTLRTNIQFMNTKRGLKTILVTTTSPAEGKSWITANLAVTFAQANKKVLLVDCDLRKGRQFSMFGVAPVPGISNYLSGINANGGESSSNIMSYIKTTEVPNLSLITAGSIPPNPSELLVSEQMQDLVERLKEEFDLVIFDGTPSVLVTDAVILSRYVDTTIIVAAYKSTKVEDLEKVKRDILNVGGKIAGVVINKVPIAQKKYESAYYYGTSATSGKRSSSGHSSGRIKLPEAKRMSKNEEEEKAREDREKIKEKARQMLEQNKSIENRNENQKETYTGITRKIEMTNRKNYQKNKIEKGDKNDRFTFTYNFRR